MGANLNGKANAIGRLLLVLLATTVIAQCSEKGRDFYVVMDTSGSMSSGTMDKVRSSIPQITELLKKGDRVHLVRFDEQAKLDKTIDIVNDPDRNSVQKWADELKPRGRYTDMQAMLQSLRTLRDNNTPEDRKSFLIVLSDGKDDPDPRARKEPIDLAKFRDKEAPAGPRESYVYYISLGAEKSKMLETGLSEMSTDVKTVETGATDQNSGANDQPGTGDANQNMATDSGDQAIDLSQATDDIQDKSTGFWGNLWNLAKANWMWLAIGLGILLLLLLLLLLWLRGRKAHKLRGQLKFWEEGTHPDLGKVVRLSKLEGKKVSVGSKPGSKIRIKDLSGGPVVFKGSTKKGVPVLKPSRIKALDFESQKNKGLISPGDSFKLGNYNFEYKDGNEKG